MLGGEGGGRRSDGGGKGKKKYGIKKRRIRFITQIRENKYISVSAIHIILNKCFPDNLRMVFRIAGVNFLSIILKSYENRRPTGIMRRILRE